MYYMLHFAQVVRFSNAKQRFCIQRNFFSHIMNQLSQWTYNNYISSTGLMIKVLKIYEPNILHVWNTNKKKHNI